MALTSDRAESPSIAVERSTDDRFGPALRSFGPIGLIALAIIAVSGNVIGPALVLVWAWRSRTPWRDLGFTKPRRWPMTLVVGVIAGAAFKIVMKAIVMPLLGADPINSAYHYLAGNGAALPGMLATVVVAGGFGEEILWRGYFFERLRRLLGEERAANVATVLIAAVLFGLAHYPDQGLAGAEQAVVTGTVFGTIFVVTRQLWLPIVVHAAFDVTAVLLIYWNLESTVAHIVFR